MKKKSEQDDVQVQLPYPGFKPLATRDEARMVASRRGRETLFYPFDKIQLREGFNTRKVYNGIKELADMIRAQGLVTPLTVDILKTGEAIVEQGNRRFRALWLLWEEGWLQDADMQGVSKGSIEVFRNDKEVTEIDRIKRILSSNHSEPLTSYEIADTILRLKTVFKLPVKEISGIVGYSRQQVENMLILANEPTEVKEAVAAGILKPTTAVALARTGASTDEKVAKVKEATEKGEVIKQKDLAKEHPEIVNLEQQENEDLAGQTEIESDIARVEENQRTNTSTAWAEAEAEGTIIPYDDTAEMKAATTSAKAPTQISQQAHDKKLNEMKDEEMFCVEVIKMLDKMSASQHVDDIHRLIPSCIQRIQSVRDYVKKIRD